MIDVRFIVEHRVDGYDAISVNRHADGWVARCGNCTYRGPWRTTKLEAIDDVERHLGLLNEADLPENHQLLLVWEYEIRIMAIGPVDHSHEPELSWRYEATIVHNVPIEELKAWVDE